MSQQIAPERIRIFVSHSHQDNEYCRSYVDTLRSHNLQVWYDEHNLGWGELRTTIQRELEQSQHFVAILSPSSVQSTWVNREIDAAIHLYDLKQLSSVVFVLAKPCAIPIMLNSWKRIEGPNALPVKATEAAERTARMCVQPLDIRDEDIVRILAIVRRAADNPRDLDNVMQLSQSAREIGELLSRLLGPSYHQ